MRELHLPHIRVPISWSLPNALAVDCKKTGKFHIEQRLNYVESAVNCLACYPDNSTIVIIEHLQALHSFVLRIGVAMRSYA